MMQPIEQILYHILLIAYDMMVSGLEVGKVEKHIERMCLAYKMQEVEVFIITSSIVVSVRDLEGKLYTQTKRIKSYQTDFYRIELLEKLTLFICENCPDAKEIEQMRTEILEQVTKEHKWKNKTTQYLVFCVVSAIFSMFFGGNEKDVIAAFLCGIFIKFTMNFVGNAMENQFIMNVMSSFIGGFMAWCLYKAGLAESIDKVIIGNIMLLIPGLAMVNAFKDLIGGEVITGLLRLADSLIQAAAIAIGFALILIPLGA